LVSKGARKMMPKEIETWIGNLNNLGTDIEPPEIQEILDREHAAAEPKFAETWLARIEEAESRRRQPSVNT